MPLLIAMLIAISPLYADCKTDNTSKKDVIYHKRKGSGDLTSYEFLVCNLIYDFNLAAQKECLIVESND